MFKSAILVSATNISRRPQEVYCNHCRFRAKYGKISPWTLLLGYLEQKGFDAIFVIVDRLSKYSHFIPLKHPYTARVLAEVFTKEIVRLHGIPSSIVSDRDPIFVSNFWQELFKLHGSPTENEHCLPSSDRRTNKSN